MKKYSIDKVCTAADLRNHRWLTTTDDKTENDPAIKKKKSQFNLHNDGNVSVLLSLKELLNVSSDWMEVKNNKNVVGASGTGMQNSLST